jgi:hypothetical protein
MEQQAPNTQMSCAVNGTASIEHTETAHAVPGPEDAQDSITGV